ncbi:MAG: rod-binding protein [Planctomycetota bacterium]
MNSINPSSMFPAVPPATSPNQAEAIESQLESLAATSADATKPEATTDPLHDAFTDFVGQTLFGSMLSTMRESVGKPAYFHGGRTEEVFQQQLDQHMVQSITDASADSLVDPMFELFQLQRR